MCLAKVCISVLLMGISNLVFGPFLGLLHIGCGRRAVKFPELSVKGLSVGVCVTLTGAVPS